MICRNDEILEDDKEYISKLFNIAKSIANNKIDDNKSKNIVSLQSLIISYCKDKISHRSSKYENILNINEIDKYMEIIKTYCNNNKLDVLDKYYNKININDEKNKNNEIIQVVCNDFYNFMKLREKAIKVSKGKDKITANDCLYLTRYANRIYNSKYYKLLYKNDIIDKYFKKLSSFYRNIRNLIYCLSNNKYKDLIINCNEKYIYPQFLDITIKPWHDILIKYENGKELIKIINEDENIKKQLVRYHSGKRRILCHAELNIIKELIKKEKKGGCIGVSKYSCYLCNMYINKLNKNNFDFKITGTHNKIYSSWLFPSIENLNKDYINEIEKYIINDIHILINKKLDELRPRINTVYSDSGESQSFSSFDDDYNIDDIIENSEITNV